MKTIYKTALIVFLGIGCIGYAISLFKPRNVQEIESRPLRSEEKSVVRNEAPMIHSVKSYKHSPSEEEIASYSKPPQAASQNMSDQIAEKISAKAKSPNGSKKQIEDPAARAALSLVGSDPEAEQYWMKAINNPDLSAKERTNLIEDLNEDGLSDPKHPSMADLPLIVNRMQLIEKLAPDAMDQTNTDAFQEAYKDLAKMYARLRQEQQ
jgi:hypothetical protein